MQQVLRFLRFIINLLIGTLHLRILCLLEISSSHLSAKITPQMEKWLLAFGQDENYEIWPCPVRAFRDDIVIVSLQTAPSKFALTYSNHTGICLKGIIDCLGLIQYIYDSTSKQLGIVRDRVGA